MEIDYFCFSVPSLTSNDYVIIEDDDENTIWIKTKEKELMDSAKKNNMLIVFDRSTKKFYMDHEEIAVKGKIIFPRSFMPYEGELLNYLEKNGALSIQTASDLKKITYWPQRIQPIHRRVIQTTYGNFQQNVESYKTIFKSIFLKTAKKSHTHCVLEYFGYIDIGGNKYFATKPTLWNISSDDVVFLSDVFESIKDEENNMDCKEYRVYVLNSTLLSISRSYVDYPTEVPSEVKTFVEGQVSRASLIPDFPKSYVLDVGQMSIGGKEVIDIIEYNPVSSSGLEVCNLLVDELLGQKQSTFQCDEQKRFVINYKE